MIAEFRIAQLADLDAVHALRCAFYTEDGSPWAAREGRRALAELLADARFGQVWVATDGEAIVGYVVLAFGFSLEFHGRDAFVDELYFAPDYRRQGLGSTALRVVEGACRHAGVHALHLEVDARNDGARTLYRAWGFAEHERLLMTKWLTSTTHRESGS